MGPLSAYLEKHSLQELAGVFSRSTIKPYCLNVLEFFNLKAGAELNEKIDEFKRMCGIAEALDIKNIILVPSPNPEGLSAREIQKDSLEIIARLTEISSRYSIKLAYEFLGFRQTSVNNLAQCYEIVMETGRDDVGIVLDCFHFYASGSKLEDLEAVDADRIFIFHLNDAKKADPWTLEDSDRLWPGDGDMPLDRIFNILREKDFDGVATIELFNPDYWKWEPEKTIRIAKEKTLKAVERYFI
jgi:2-keto-myo-inositol isomerase